MVSILALSQRVQGAVPAAGGKSGAFGGQGKVPWVVCDGRKRNFESWKIFDFLKILQVRVGQGGGGMSDLQNCRHLKTHMLS